MGNAAAALKGSDARVRTLRAPSFAPWEIGPQMVRLFEYTDLLLTLTHHRIRVRYKQSALGIAWALLQPLALMAIYTIIFSVVTRVKTDGAPYSIFVYAALLPWTFFATAVGSAANGLVTHANLITKVYFPREIIPITYVLAGVFDFIIASIVLVGMMLFYRVQVTLQVLWVIPIMLTAIAFVSALALFLSALQVWFRDIGLAIALILQVWMFASPVVYPLSQVPARMYWWYILNPMTGVVENFRRAVIQGVGPDIRSLATSAAITAVALPLAYMYFKKREATMADII